MTARAALTEVRAPAGARPSSPRIALLTGGVDRPYALGLAEALLAAGLSVDFVASDQLESRELRSRPGLRFLNLRGDLREEAGPVEKVTRVLRYYARLVRYAAAAELPIFHILWNNKFEVLDRTALMLYYRLCGRKIALTAHNVNAAKRDGGDSRVNRLSLRIQYRLADHIFVHTEAMKAELRNDFRVADRAITVIPFGINDSVPVTSLTHGEARRRLDIAPGDKTILFFGHIGRYKGLDVLAEAFTRLLAGDAAYRLIVAGQPDAAYAQALPSILQRLEASGAGARVVRRLGYVPEADTEVYFKAADVLALPYTSVSQSGVLILGYRFGLPAIAADVGSFREDIVSGRTGLLFGPGDAGSLQRAIEAYFASDLFARPEARRRDIQDYARARYSWDAVGRATRRIYDALLTA